jgi:hypothetical protein
VNSPAPVPLTLLICDHVWRDPHSGKYDLLGTFSAIGSSVFPCSINLAVYFALTEGRGELPIRLELVDVDEERPAIFKSEGMFRFVDPRHVIEGCFSFDTLKFPQPGEYCLKLFVSGELLMVRSLHVAEWGSSP